MEPAYKDDPDAIVWAAVDGYCDLVLACLDQGTSPDTTDDRGRTALHAASNEGWSHIVELLLDRGAGVNAADAEGDTPHDYAIFNGHREIAELLVARGAIVRLGQSARQQQEDIIMDGFDSVDAAKRLIAEIQKKKSPDDA